MAVLVDQRRAAFRLVFKFAPVVPHDTAFFHTKGRIAFQLAFHHRDAVALHMMAVTVEALVEYAKTFGKAILEKQWKTAATQAGAVALGVSLCFSAGADFYAALGVSFNAAWLGVALTGVFASRGANYVSDLVKKLQALGAAQAER